MVMDGIANERLTAGIITDSFHCPRPPGAVNLAPLAFSYVNRFSMGLLYGRAGRLLAAKKRRSPARAVPPSILKAIVRAKGPGKSLVVSDIAYPGGCPPGEFNWGGEVVVLEPSGFLHMPSREVSSLYRAY